MPKKKKVCVITPVHWSHSLGGIEYQVKLLIESLSKNADIEITYLSQKIADRYSPDGYNLIKISKENLFQNYASFFDGLSLWGLLKKIGPDIIYQNGGCAYTGISALYAKKAKCKMVWHIASDNDLMLRNNVAMGRPHKLLERGILNYGIRNCEIIIAQSEDQRRIVRKLNKRAAIHVIRNFHPLPINNSSHIKLDQIIWVANLKKLKQPELYIGLARELLRRNINVKCIMVGSQATYPPGYQKRIEESIRAAKNLEYLGGLPIEHVNKLIGQSKLLINTSRWEGFPNTFIQAWMRKTPVVSLNCDPDHILSYHHCGIVSKTYENLVDDVVFLLKHENRRGVMGNMAKIFAYENFSLSNLVHLDNIILNN